MNKAFLIILVFFASCFEVEVKPNKQLNAQSFASERVFYGFRTDTIDGMKYGFYYVAGQTSQTGYDIEIINLTKDSLEVELLKKQLGKK